MAGQADVETAIVNLVAGALYPNGTGQPSVAGVQCSVARGWPTEAGVNDAVNAGNVLITVHQRAGFSRDATRYSRAAFTVSQIAPTLTATLSGFAVTFGGTVTAGNTVGVLSASVAYTHVATSTDTLSTIASALASTIPGATASGAVLTLPAGNAAPGVVVVNGGVVGIEVGRQQAGFSVDVWAPSPALRDAIFATLEPAIPYSFRLTLADGSIATLMQFQESGPDDLPSREKMFRRNLLCIYDYPLIYTSTAQAAAAILVNSTPDNGPTTAIYAV
ncbi:MAG TPA: hypothetical protein PK231_03015 [Acidocella sp.]|nr:hypothetical protein [Acidocella sp.]